MRHIFIAVGVFVLGIILLSISGAIWCNGGRDDIFFLILIAILYLSAVIGGSTALILDALYDNKE